MKNYNLEEIEYIDIHSHIHDIAFDNDRDEVIKRMQKNKIATITIGTDLLESERAKILADKYENIFYTSGLHPHDNLIEFNNLFKKSKNNNLIKNYFEKLKLLANNKKCLAIGECGLDYFYIYREKENIKKILDLKDKNILKKIELEKQNQKIIFEKHIDLANELNLPLMLHIRPSEINGNREDAYLDAIKILKEKQEYFKKNNLKEIRGNFHFFVSNKNILEKILKELKNFSISISAVCTITNEYDDMIRFCPLEKINIETDSPYVLSKKRKEEFKNQKNNNFKNRNESNFVIDVFDRICEIKNIKNKNEIQNFKNILKENFRKMYLLK